MNNPDVALNLAFDSSDVDKWIAKPVIFAELYYPPNVTAEVSLPV